MTRPLTVLVVEDDDDDFFFTERVLRRKTKGPILHVESGSAALDYLNGSGPYADRNIHPFPDIVLLDLKMNELTGHDVLAAIRAKPLPQVPRIFVLTGSDEPKDRELVRASGVAAGYIVKPLSGDHLDALFGPERGSATQDGTIGADRG